MAESAVCRHPAAAEVAGGTASCQAASAGSTAWVIALGLLALWGLHALTVIFSGAGLHVDEAQYWEWSRALQWGYWSKPPGVAALMAASTALFGDGVLGLRLLGMACWPAAAGVLAGLAGAMAGPRAALWTAAIFAATPACGLLGLVSTTDGPLMLCWSLTLAACWRALQAEGADRPAWGAWAAAGLAAGLGLLSKYTLAALLLSVPLGLWPAWRHAGRSALVRRLSGVLLASSVAGLLLLPNLWWNARHGWPTWLHTAAITAQATPASGRTPLASLTEFMAGQLLLVGPAALLLAGMVQRRALARPPWPASNRGEGFALATALPLLALGLLQAWHAKAQMNWTAPALAGLSLWLGLRATRTGLGRRALLVSTAGGLALTTALALAGAFAPAVAGQRADIWARMRGWDEVLMALRPALASQPGLPLVAAERDVLVQAAYAWRDMGRPLTAWPPAGASQHHYEQFRPLVAAGGPWPETVLLLCEDEPPHAAWARYPHWQRLARATSRHGRQLTLWRGDRPQSTAGPLDPPR